MRFAAPLLAVLLAACPAPKDEEEPEDSAPPINQDTDTGGVTHAPVVAELIFDSCVYPFADEGDQPAILVAARATDEDADIHFISMDVWWDATVDGQVDVTGPAKTGTEPYHVQDAETHENLDAASEVTFGTYLNVTGDEAWLLYETEHEFAVVVYDATELASEPFIDTWTTPAATITNACD
jgi:hypothetical protein